VLHRQRQIEDGRLGAQLLEGSRERAQLDNFVGREREVAIPAMEG
jgi:hypothetical protein